MRRRTQIGMVIVALLVAVLLLAGVALAADVPGTLIRSAYFSGGEPVMAGDFVLHGTVGEPVAGPPLTQDAAQVAAGYWQDVTPGETAYLPLVRK
ncbi:MAG: hypothetical protein H3C34_03895 [Caldilineaceae bacterium]|nr:hypothetical protein [Caldilineaceae bacterium]